MVSHQASSLQLWVSFEDFFDLTASVVALFFLVSCFSNKRPPLLCGCRCCCCRCRCCCCRCCCRCCCSPTLTFIYTTCTASCQVRRSDPEEIWTALRKYLASVCARHSLIMHVTQFALYVLLLTVAPPLPPQELYEGMRCEGVESYEYGHA